MKRKISALQIVRVVIQIICFFLLPGLFIDAFNGVKAVITMIAAGTWDLAAVLPQVFPAALLILATLFLGRFFCGYMCAFGTLSDALRFIGLKVFKLKKRVPERADGILKWVKYILLAALVATWVFGIKMLSGWSPWDAFGILDAWPPYFVYAITNFTVGTILLILLMIGSMFIERFFCRYFCPLGAIFSIVTKLRITRISKKRDVCGKCRLCTSVCPMGIPMYHYEEISSGECIACMKCVSNCPKKNASCTVAAKNAAPLLASALAAATIGLYYVGNMGVNTLASALSETDAADQDSGATPSPNATADPVDEQESPAATQQTDGTTPSPTQTDQATQEPSSGYQDGTYQGSGTGFKGTTVTVSVTIEGGAITDIVTVSSGSSGKDEPYYNRAFSGVTSDIIAKQSADVDAVSGATYSSRGIISAVADALAQALS